MKFPKKYLLIIVASINVLLAAGCSTTSTDPSVVYKGVSEQQLFRQAEISLAKHNYTTASKEFEALDSLYPFGSTAEQAQLDLMYAYYMDYDNASAAATAERFIRIYPRSANVDYAYYIKGVADYEQDRGWIERVFPTDLSQRDPGTTKQSFDDFAQLVKYFPNSQYAPDARQRMVYLRNLFAGYELNVANYYYSKGAYVAAINRANYILQHYNGTPQVEDALGLMVRSYRALHMTALANQTLQILQMNYPHGRVLQEM